MTYKLLDGNVGYLRIKQFQERTHEELMTATAKMRAESKNGTLSGILLDLRANPGGLVDEATEIADEFLASGGIYTMRHRGQVVEDLKARPGGAFVDLPTVALVNEWSASASELLVGALQDNHRATVVGSNTFGKGSVQSILPLPNGAGLKLTTARYYTPSGHAIQADGIHPDIVIEPGTRGPSEPLRRRSASATYPVTSPPKARKAATSRRRAPRAATQASPSTKTRSSARARATSRKIRRARRTSSFASATKR